MTKITTAFLAILTLVSSDLFVDLATADDPSRPNIVFLLTDDQATCTMGCYGNRDVKTPRLDQLAQAGLVFDNHYVTTAICMASRATIMTGLHEYRTGCNFTHGNMQPDQWANSYPMLLRKSGYRTAFAGKFGFEIDGQTELPSNDFDQWGGGPGQTHFKTKLNESIKEYAAQFPHATLAYGAFGRDFIRESVASDQPFCLSISYKAPHRPVTPDPQFNHVYANQSFQKPANYGRVSGNHFSKQSQQGRQYPRFEEWKYDSDYDGVMQKYNQLVYAIDQSVGMILDEIEAQGVAENTVVIFTSDNGYLCGAHGYGSKVLPYEESVRVPLIIFDPRNEKTHGRRSRSLTGNVDFAPTILELANVVVPENLDGISLLPILANPVTRVRDHLALTNFWGPASTHSLAVVTQDWKYIYWYSQENGMTPAEELFDMRGDRMELKNYVDDPNVKGDLESIREIYDRAAYAVGEKAINADYRRYGEIFDRKTGWDRKAELLKTQN